MIRNILVKDPDKIDEAIAAMPADPNCRWTFKVLSIAWDPIKELWRVFLKVDVFYE